MRARPAPRYGANVRACMRTHSADVLSFSGRPFAHAPCAAGTALVTCALCEQILQGATSSHVGRLFDAAPQRTRCGGAAGGSSSSVGQRGERFALYLWVLYGSRLLLMAGLERVSCSMPAVLCVYR